MTELEIQKGILIAVQSIAESQKLQLESQLRIEADTKDVNDRLLKVAEDRITTHHLNKMQ